MRVCKCVPLKLFKCYLFSFVDEFPIALENMLMLLLISCIHMHSLCPQKRSRRSVANFWHHIELYARTVYVCALLVLSEGKRNVGAIIYSAGTDSDKCCKSLYRQGYNTSHMVPITSKLIGQSITGLHECAHSVHCAKSYRLPSSIAPKRKGSTSPFVWRLKCVAFLQLFQIHSWVDKWSIWQNMSTYVPKHERYTVKSADNI